jgi:RNA polymerase sigma-70 factor (ECF subfamily)
MLDDPRTDDALLAAWREGEHEAGFRLFERYYDMVARFFHAKVGDDGVDLIQRTFLGCVESLPRFRGQGSFRSYLFAIAYRQLCQFLRDRNRERRRFDFTELSVADLRPSATAELGHRQEIQLLLAALRQIPLDFQILLELHYWEGVTTGELAEILEIPPSTARARLMRARVVLAAKMGELSQSPAVAESTMTNLERWATEIRSRTPSPPPPMRPSPPGPGKPKR